MFQKYLNSNNSNIITIYHVPQKINKIIVLFPAFLESAADKEYFLRRLASVLSGKSILVVQVEPFAHGHSFGLVKDITIEKIINNAIDIAYDLKNNYNKPIILLLNGLYCNIICNKRIRELYDLFLCINHTFIDNEDIYAIEEIRDDYFELGHYIFNDEKLMNMFKRMGSSTYNICSQLFSKKL